MTQDLFVGQKKLLDRLFGKDLTQQSLSNLPKTIMLLGESGCGKHTVVDIMSEQFQIRTMDISDKLSDEELGEFQLCPINTLYYIETSKLSIQNQNSILKFIEEPTMNMWVVLLCDDKSKLLDTIVNRCVVYEFEKYTVEELSKFIDKDSTLNRDLLFKLCTTPGQVLSVLDTDLDKLYNLCDTIVTKVNQAPYYNVLSLINKINFKDEYDKYDFKLFYKMLILTSYENYIKTNSAMSYSVYNTVKDFTTRYERDGRLNVQILTELLLTKLWRIQ